MEETRQVRALDLNSVLRRGKMDFRRARRNRRACFFTLLSVLS